MVTQQKVSPPATVRERHIGFNGRIAAWITERVGSMWAFYVGAVFQFGWMSLALLGFISFDPYPFAFLLFLSSLAQLILMFIIMVGQEVLGRAGDNRAQQTLLDAEAVLHECKRLQEHLTAQDRVIVKICDHIRNHAGKDDPIHGELGGPPPARGQPHVKSCRSRPVCQAEYRNDCQAAGHEPHRGRGCRV